MGDWYELGVSLGTGVALGVLLVALLAPRLGPLVPLALAVAAGAVAGWFLGEWLGLGGGAAGAVLGAAGTALVARGALGRGGTAGGTAILLVVGALVLAGLAWVPVVGYVLAVAVPALGLRARRRAPERYAGLRTLAK